MKTRLLIARPGEVERVDVVRGSGGDPDPLAGEVGAEALVAAHGIDDNGVEGEWCAFAARALGVQEKHTQQVQLVFEGLARPGWGDHEAVRIAPGRAPPV